MQLLKILSKSEITGFGAAPVFNPDERKKFFNLPSGLNQSWRKLRMAENQILCILQFGYVRGRQKFLPDIFNSKTLNLSNKNTTFHFHRMINGFIHCLTITRHQHITLEFYSSRLLAKSASTVSQVVRADEQRLYSAVNQRLPERENLERQIDSLAKEISDEQTVAEFYEILQRGVNQNSSFTQHF